MFCMRYVLVVFVAAVTSESVFPDDSLSRGPSFVSEPPSRVEFSNSSGTVISCVVDGRPRPTVKWVKHDGETLQELPGLRHTRHDGSLVFPPFAGEDYRADVHASTYRCEASNVVGTIGSREVHVRAVVIQRYEIRLFDEFVLRGNMAVLRCPIPSYVSDYVRVTSWERIDGFMITSGVTNGKYGMLENGDMYLQDTADHDSSYSFRCHTENLVTREKKVSVNYVRIIVTEPQHGQPPRIMQRSNIVTVPSGQRTTLFCAAQGYPVPIYRWHKLVGNQAVSIQLRSSGRQDGGVLTFHKALAGDGGRYVCHASNALGEDTIQTELVVEEPVRAMISPRILQTDVGRIATFSCNVTGNTAGSVVWRKDMNYLSSADPRVLFPTPYVVQVRQLRRQDSGMYQCFVLRDLVSAQASARLVIGDLAPRLKVTFTEKTVRPGSYVSLSCVVTGNPEPHVRWTLDDIWPISTRPGVLVSSYLSGENTVTSYVNFTSIGIIDSGVYACEAINDAGRAYHSRRLNVFGPLFVRPLDNLTALAGASFSVMCPFGGYPFDTVSWKRDGRELPVNQRQRVYPNGTLHITEVQPGVDDGRYSCDVTSGQGVPASRTLRIVIRAGPKLASFAFRDNLHEGMRTAVTCIVLAGDGPLNTRWLKDGRPVTEHELDVNILQEDDGFISTLTFKNLTYKHNGNYSCISTNDVASGSYSATLTVKVPPRWMLEPRDVSAVAGRPTRIDCQADGVPQPHVRWKLATSHPPEQFKTIVSSSHIHILVNGSLNFRSVEAGDAGNYLCEANNGVGSGLSAVVRLTVHSAPHFHTKFVVVSTRRGDKAVIDCEPDGDQPMYIVWRKNGVNLDLTNEPRYSQTSEKSLSGEHGRLIIEKSERKDSALMTCTASNDYGEDSINIQITVQDIPDAPQNLEIHDVSSRSVRLTWKKPFDGNFPITQYTVMWRQVDSATTGGPLNVPGIETTLIIRGLKPKTRYFFRVKCENTLGASQFGAEVAITSLEEPPSSSPRSVKVIPLSSKSVNVTWLSPPDDSNSVDGYYVGFKTQRSSEAFTFKPIERRSGLNQYLEVTNLNRYTEYNIVVQAYNSRGAGPPSEEYLVRTLEFDPPTPPIMRTYFATAKTLKLSWEARNTANAPVSGYILHHRMEANQWQETHLPGDRTAYTLHDLQCGTSYAVFLIAFNSAGRGNGSEIISAKTDGSPPIAPEKRLFLSVNSTAVLVNLNSWHNGGCPITFFVIQYRPSGQQEWTLVSNNVIPEQQNITITDLTPGTWYSMLISARNDAGSTDAEYVFATMTLSGEYPPRPFKVSDVNSAFYKHLTITVPVVSSIIVLVVVMCAVCFITRRRSTGSAQRNQNENDGDPIKAESVPLSVTYDSSQEPTYLPAPYATSRVTGYSREHCILPNAGNQQNVGTFGSTRSGYGYNVPHPPRRVEKGECVYESPTIYYPSYRHTGIDLRAHHDHPIYEVPDRGRMKIDSSHNWREEGDGNSSTESDNEDLLYTVHSQEERIEARESETECDRLWKTFEVNQYEGSKRWQSDHAVLA